MSISVKIPAAVLFDGGNGGWEYGKNDYADWPSFRRLPKTEQIAWAKEFVGAGGKIREPVEVTVFADGQVSFQDGHHRVIAGALLGLDIPARINFLNFPPKFWPDLLVLLEAGFRHRQYNPQKWSLKKTGVPPLSVVRQGQGAVDEWLMSAPRTASTRWIDRVAGLQNLRPNTKLVVYHGTRLAHVLNLINGFDANKVVSRDYGGPRHAGLFVAPDLQTAERFSSYGEIILELVVTAKHLHGTDYSGNIGRSQQMDQRTVDYLQGKYPDSFRPYLSDTLLQANEPQALLRGLVKPRQIRRVRYKPLGGPAKWYSRAEFLNLGLEAKPANDPYGRSKEVRDFGYDMSDPTLTLAEFKAALSVALGVDINRINRTFERMVGLGDRGRASIEQLIQKAGFGPTAGKVFLDKVFTAWDKKAARRIARSFTLNALKKARSEDR